MKANYYGEERELRAVTCQRARRNGADTSRSYGYTILVEPPIVTVQTGIDVEGYGWHNWTQPRRIVTKSTGWYKTRAIAEGRIAQLAGVQS